MKELMLVAVVTLGAAAVVAQVRQGAWTPVVETMERGYSSISYWTYRDDGVEVGGGRISVEYGKPQWPATLDDADAFDGATVGKLWRLGNNKWTILDTQLNLRFGARTVEPGIYYLVLDRPSKDVWELVFVHPRDVAPGYIDAWAAQARPDEVPRAFSIPLDYRASDALSRMLDIQLSLDASEMGRGGLTIKWGAHVLSASMVIDVPSPTFYRSEPDSR